jgi:hypothetical protein
VVFAITDFGEGNIAYVFRVKYSESPWFAGRMHLLKIGEESSCNAISIVASICYHGDIVDLPLL